MVGTLIIGCGNPLRGDDGLAWHAIAHLGRRHRFRRTPMICCHQLVPELADYLRTARRVIFIDARAPAGGENAPGTVSVERLEPRTMSGSPLGHHFDPAGLLGFAGQVYGSQPEAFAASIVGQSFDVSDTLSLSVQRAMPGLIHKVAELLRWELGRFGSADGKRKRKATMLLKTKEACIGSKPPTRLKPLGVHWGSGEAGGREETKIFCSREATMLLNTKDGDLDTNPSSPTSATQNKLADGKGLKTL